MSMSPPPLRVHGLETPSLGDPDGHYWVKVSTTFLADPSIKDGELRVLAAIQTLANGRGVCQASNGLIAIAAGKPERTVERLIKGLAKKGIIERDQAGPFRTLRANFALRRALDPPRKSDAETDQKNPAKVRTNPRKPADVPPQNCGSTSAPMRPILRFESDSKDSSSDRAVASAGEGQAPPPPPPEIGSKSSLLRSPGADSPVITGGDVLDPRSLAEAERVMTHCSPKSMAFALASLSLTLHRRAIAAGFEGSSQAPSPSIQDQRANMNQLENKN